jgi:hypothetical protein
MGFHLFFIGKNFELQKAEYQSLWKRAALGAVFTLGFGLTVVRVNLEKNWQIVVLGILSPTIIYYIKYLSTFMLPMLGINAPAFLLLYPGSAEFYVPKISYVFYCLPAFALSLGMLLMQIKKEAHSAALLDRLFWGGISILVLGVFYLENIKNGILYSLVLIILFLVSIFKGKERGISKSALCIALIILVASSLLVFNNLKINKTWAYLIADLEVAQKASPQEIWKTPESFYPKNAMGISVVSTTFDRAFYFRVGVNLLIQNPLGFGLVQSSFGHLAKEHWPNAPIIQSHSGWLDLALGLGIPGALLILLSALMAIKVASLAIQPWNVFGTWALGSVLILYVSTEVAQKNYLDTLVWLTVFVASLGLTRAPKLIDTF